MVKRTPHFLSLTSLLLNEFAIQMTPPDTKSHRSTPFLPQKFEFIIFGCQHMQQIAEFYIYVDFTMQYYAYAKLHNGNISTLLQCEQWKMRNEQFSGDQEFGDVIVSAEARIRPAWNQSADTHTYLYAASELEQNGVFFLLQPQDRQSQRTAVESGSCACLRK